MDNSPIHIKFENSQNPNAEFDIISFQDVLTREDMDHSPLELHLVEFYMILFIEDGVGFHTIDFTDYSFKKGSVITIRKDQIHKFHKNEHVQGSILLFTDEFLVSYLEELEALKSLQLFNELLGDPKLQLSDMALTEMLSIINRLRKEYFNPNDEYTMGIIRSELHILIAKLYRIKSLDNNASNQNRYLSQFIDFQNLVEKHASKLNKVSDYAKLIGVSSKTLNTTTKRIVNKTAKEFVDDICTKQIKRLLINTELSIKEIAHESGFEESTNFYKYFKRQTQLTPEQFRSTFR